MSRRTAIKMPVDLPSLFAEKLPDGYERKNRPHPILKPIKLLEGGHFLSHSPRRISKDLRSGIG